jgi:hypothetical protein
VERVLDVAVDDHDRTIRSDERDDAGPTYLVGGSHRSAPVSAAVT